MSQVLGGMWQSSEYLESDTTSAHSKFMRDLGDYITSNVTFTVSFTGTLISYPFTPITTVDSAVTINGSPTSTFQNYCDDPKGGDGLTEFNAWIKRVYQGIAQALIVGPLTAPTGPVTAFSLMVNPTWTRNELLTVHQNNWNDPQLPTLTKLAELICTDMRQFYTPTYPAIYAGSYTGLATVTLVSTP